MFNKYYHALFILTILSIYCLPPVKSQANDSFWESRLKNFDFFPEYHIDYDLRYFTLHKNDYFKTRYFIEINTNLEFALFSHKKILYSICSYELHAGMGQTPGNVFFDPMEIDFGAILMPEYRFSTIYLQGGLEHRCFHEIDKQEYETVYWNKLFVATGSSNYRFFDYWHNLAMQDGWTSANRLSWYVKWGYYVKDFFGLMDRDLLNDNNYNVHEAFTDIRYAFYRRKSWVVNFRGQTKIGLWHRDDVSCSEKSAYWRIDLGLELNSRRGKKGAMIFIYYTIDDIPLFEGIPRFSKDRLLQIGVRLFS